MATHITVPVASVGRFWMAKRNFLIEQTVQCDLLKSTAAEQRASVQDSERVSRPHAATGHTPLLLFI